MKDKLYAGTKGVIDFFVKKKNEVAKENNILQHEEYNHPVKIYSYTPINKFISEKQIIVGKYTVM